MRLYKGLFLSSIFSLVAAISYTYIIHGVALYIHRNQPTITSLAEGNQVIEEERKKFGIESKISLQVSQENKLGKYDAYGLCHSNRDGIVLIINRSDLKRGVIKHEMHHAYQNGCKEQAGEDIEESIRIHEQSLRRKQIKPMMHILWEEWKNTYSETMAFTYEVTGLKF